MLGSVDGVIEVVSGWMAKRLNSDEGMVLETGELSESAVRGSGAV